MGKRTGMPKGRPADGLIRKHVTIAYKTEEEYQKLLALSTRERVQACVGWNNTFKLLQRIQTLNKAKS